MFYVTLPDESARGASRMVRAMSDALAAWGALAAHQTGLPVRMTDAAGGEPGPINPASWTAEAAALYFKAYRASWNAAAEGVHVLTGMAGAELTPNPFGVTGLFTTAPPPAETAAPKAGKAAKAAKASPTPAREAALDASRPAMRSAKPKGDMLLAAPLGAPDDLTQIRGIGPKLALALAEIGIFHFWQIAALTEEEIEWVNDKLKARGPVQPKAWVAQAKALAGQ